MGFFVCGGDLHPKVQSPQFRIANFQRTSVFLVTLMTVIQLVIVLPFVEYLFYFLEPDKVVDKIMRTGLTAAEGTIGEHSKDIDKKQAKLSLAIEHLMDAANAGEIPIRSNSLNSALKKKDRNIAAEIVDALCSFCGRYGRRKANMFWTWFLIPEWIKAGGHLTSTSDRIRARFSFTL